MKKLTQSALAVRLGYSPAALREWRKRPGAPQTWNEYEWRRFIDEQGLGMPGHRIPPARERLIQARLREEVITARLRRKKEEASLVPAEEVERFLTQTMGMSRMVLINKVQNEMPARAVGLSASELHLLGRNMVDEILATLHAGQEQFSAEHPRQEDRVEELAAGVIAGLLDDTEQGARIAKELRRQELLRLYATEHTEELPIDPP